MSQETIIKINQLGIAVDENNATQNGWLTINAPHRGDEKPSFAINIQHGGWKDNATGESGDIYSLVKLLNPGMNFAEAKEFVDGKGAGKKLHMKKPEYFEDLDSPFWTKDRKKILKSSQSHLGDASKSKILNELNNYDGISRDTLKHFECGLINWDFGGTSRES